MVTVRDSRIRLAAFLREGMNGRIGIHLGGVIVRNLQEVTGKDTSLQNSSGEQPAPACEGRVWIATKAGPRMQDRTLAWLQSVVSFSRTVMQLNHLRFCLQREDKASIC